MRNGNFYRTVLASVLFTAIVLPLTALPASAQQMAKNKALTEDQKIQHMLNRLAFGARPGDVEKVKAIGLKNYIEQQLNPGSVADSVAESKLANLSVLKMSNEELFAKYPNPAALLQLVSEELGITRGDAQQARQNRNNQTQNAAMEGEKKQNNASPNQMPDQMDEADRRAIQQKVAEIYQKYELGRPQQISQQLNASRILRAVYSERQLSEVMVDFWTNHFNVYANKQAVRWFLPEYDRDVIRPHALGNFKDLLMATAKSPAMLYYLDNYESVSPNAEMPGQRQNAQNLERLKRAETDSRLREQIKRNRNINDQQLDQLIKRAKQNMGQQQNRMRRGINENYAREIMELHTLGVDGGYTQKDVQEVARCFTGWTIIDARGYRRAAAQVITGRDDKRGERMARAMGLPEDAESGTFYFNSNWHDKGEKTVLGQKVDEGGMKDGLKVIDILVKHPSTAKFIARKLAVKFVSDNPSEALVDRVAQAFNRSEGDIKATLRALFNDPEFFAPENYRAKIKTPFEVVISGIRTLGAETNGLQVQAALAKMGEPLYGWQAPTGYPDTAEDWVNTGALLERMNFAVAVASNRIPGTKADLGKLAGSTADKSAILDRFIGTVLNGEISPATKSTLLKQMDQPLPEPSYAMADDGVMENAAMEGPQRPGRPGQNAQQRRGQQNPLRLLPPSGDPEQFKIAGLILGSPEFQRQ